MLDLQFLIPEIFLSISIFSLLMIGVFIKDSFQTIYRLSIIVILSLILIILTGSHGLTKVFSDSFVIDNFSSYSKILILISTFFVLLISKRHLIDIKNNKFEYPIIILLSILGMFIMVSSNDLILFYLGLELQSLALYILASIDRDNIKSSEEIRLFNLDEYYNKMNLKKINHLKINEDDYKLHLQSIQKIKRKLFVFLSF